MTPKIGKRLTEAQTQKAAVLAAYIDASPHEWPKGVEDTALLCHGYLDLQAELAEARGHSEQYHRNWLSLQEATAERDQLRALADAARDGMRQLGEDLEASRAEVERLRGALEEACKDNEELDGTDAAHPAWWRGNNAGVAQVCAKINAILDGADVSGAAAESWEFTRRRVAEARWCDEVHRYTEGGSGNG